MVIDTSAIAAILFGESEGERLAHAVAADATRLMSSFTALECAIVVEARKGEAGARELDLLLHRADVRIVALDSDQVELARNAWRHYGKGRHAAGLNVGDCCAYALAQTSGEPLLFKGGDFAQTDVTAVPY